MDSTDVPVKNRSASYADALRGHKMFAPKSKPARDKKVDEAPIPKEEPKSAQGVAQKSSQKKAPKGAHKKEPKAGAKAAREGDGEGPRPKQQAKGAKHKNSKPKARATREQPAKSQFSYAEAVKGKSSLLPLRTQKVEGGQDAATEPFPTIEDATRKLQETESPQGEPTQTSVDVEATTGAVGDGSQNPLGRQGDAGKVVRHPAPRQLRAWALDPTLAEFTPTPYAPQLRQHYSMHDSIRPHDEAEQEYGYNQRPRRVSAGNLSSSSSHLSSASPQQPTSAPSSSTNNTFPSNTSNTSSEMPTDFIQFCIQQAVEADHRRMMMVRQRDNRTRAAIAAHDRGDIQLWDNDIEWDVLITCGNQCWKVHHDILCRESELFMARLPPKNRNGGYVTLDCTSFCDEVQLAHALFFMYNKSSKIAEMLTHSALNGDSILVATFNYICGASVACRSLMDAACHALRDATFCLHTFLAQTPLPTLENLDLGSLHPQLAQALHMAYEQGSRNVSMFRLREALAHLLDAVLLRLVLNPGFKRALDLVWAPFLLPQAVSDMVFFSRSGELDEMWRVLKERVRRARAVERERARARERARKRARERERERERESERARERERVYQDFTAGLSLMLMGRGSRVGSASGSVSASASSVMGRAVERDDYEMEGDDIGDRSFSTVTTAGGSNSSRRSSGVLSGTFSSHQPRTEEELQHNFEIWGGANYRQEVLPSGIWRGPQPEFDSDNRMLNGDITTPWQFREVINENLRNLPEPGPGPVIQSNLTTPRQFREVTNENVLNGPGPGPGSVIPLGGPLNRAPNPSVNFRYFQRRFLRRHRVTLDWFLNSRAYVNGDDGVGMPRVRSLRADSGGDF